MGTGTRSELLHALRIAVDKADEVPSASVQTLEGVETFFQVFASRVVPAFGRALHAGIAMDECVEAFGAAGPAFAGMMKTWETNLRRAEIEARGAEAEAQQATVSAAPPVDAWERYQALRALRAVANVTRTRCNHNATVNTALGNAVTAGVPVAVALELLERHGVQVIEGLGVGLTDSHTPVANSELRAGPAVPLPAPIPDHIGSAPAARVEADVRPAHPARESIPDPAELEADLRNIDAAAAALGVTFSEPVRRVVAGMVNDVRNLARRRMERDARPRRSLGGVRVLRRSRAPRAPRRRAHRSAIAPMRDGPPPSDDAPPPVAGRSPLGAIGGSR